MTPDQYQSRIKSCLSMATWDKAMNSAIWAECKSLSHDEKVAINIAVDMAEAAIHASYKAEACKASPPKLVRMTEEELADSIDILLTTKVADKTISAAEIAQLSAIRNLKKTDRDVNINVVNYKDLP